MIPLNYDKYIKQTNEIIKHWNKRYLTPLGKITMIKTFIFSKFIHLFTTLPSPGPKITDSINKMIYKFLWDNKPDNVARKLTIHTNLNGGLNMKNITTFIQVLKITWMRRLFRWSTLGQPLKSTNSPICKIFDIGPNYASTISKSINQFILEENVVVLGRICKIKSTKNPTRNTLVPNMAQNRNKQRNTIYPK